MFPFQVENSVEKNTPHIMMEILSKPLLYRSSNDPRLQKKYRRVAEKKAKNNLRNLKIYNVSKK
jgi:hypothetical protein